MKGIKKKGIKKGLVRRMGSGIENVDQYVIP